MFADGRNVFFEKFNRNRFGIFHFKNCGKMEYDDYNHHTLDFYDELENVITEKQQHFNLNDEYHKKMKKENQLIKPNIIFENGKPTFSQKDPFRFFRKEGPHVYIKENDDYFEYLPKKPSFTNKNDEVSINKKKIIYFEYDEISNDPIMKINSQFLDKFQKIKYAIFGKDCRSFRSSETEPFLCYDKKTKSITFYQPTFLYDRKKSKNGIDSNYVDKARDQAYCLLKFLGIPIVIHALGAKIEYNYFINVATSPFLRYPSVLSKLKDETDENKTNENNYTLIYTSLKKIPEIKKNMSKSFEDFSVRFILLTELSEMDEKTIKFSALPKTIISTTYKQFPDFDCVKTSFIPLWKHYSNIYYKMHQILTTNSAVYILSFLDLGLADPIMALAAETTKTLFFNELPGSVQIYTENKRNNYILTFYSRNPDSVMANANAIVGAFRTSNVVVIPISSPVTPFINALRCAFLNWSQFCLVKNVKLNLNVILFINEHERKFEIENSIRTCELFKHQISFFSTVKFYFAFNDHELQSLIEELKQSTQQIEHLNVSTVRHGIAAFSTVNDFAEFLELSDD
ncbi:hypothetical protein TRFO_17843 [Tritrichomonas foetus]|uniref:Uncharacterized protein n=1 Tax=Tritrichomonas foetus TaxID=1144522 RepID=A0A1J4KMI9_9EUKA|nr:hypothetical protein TRFO_17843 [Tritrichomonas foetus]|eukprot:OHT12362.1 hypothetical protein TRFO_17843 [Tritrichomonas foetus]